VGSTFSKKKRKKSTLQNQGQVHFQFILPTEGKRKPWLLNRRGSCKVPLLICVAISSNEVFSCNFLWLSKRRYFYKTLILNSENRTFLTPRCWGGLEIVHQGT